jgi:hypothetical protein
MTTSSAILQECFESLEYNLQHLRLSTHFGALLEDLNAVFREHILTTQPTSFPIRGYNVVEDICASVSEAFVLVFAHVQQDFDATLSPQYPLHGTVVSRQRRQGAAGRAPRPFILGVCECEENMETSLGLRAAVGV